jgi:hypothetical protein
MRDLEYRGDRKMEWERNAREYLYAVEDPNVEIKNGRITYPNGDYRTWEEIENAFISEAKCRGFTFFYGHRQRTLGYVTNGSRKKIQITPFTRDDIFREFALIAHEVGHILAGHPERPLPRAGGPGRRTHFFEKQEHDMKRFKREVEAYETAEDFIKKYRPDLPPVWEEEKELHLNRLQFNVLVPR